MSKEEILKGLEYKHREELQYSHENVLHAMEEYAQQEAIAFAEWIYSGGWTVFLDTDENIKYWHTNHITKSFATEQLYTLFQKNRQQSKIAGIWIKLNEDGSNEPKEDGTYFVKMHTGSMRPKIILTQSIFTKYPNGRSKWNGASDWNYVTEYLEEFK